MVSRHPVRALILILLLSLPSWAQTPEASPLTDEQRKAQEELKQKALSLLDEVIKDSESFKHNENRIRIRAQAANVLWQHDEARARILFKEVMAGVVDLLREQETDVPESPKMLEGPRSLRRELVQMLAQRDTRLARDFMRATRPTQSQPANAREALPDQPLEISLATQIAMTDPKQALEIAEESLSRGLSYELPGLLSALRDTDPEAAARLANQVVLKLRSEKLDSNDMAKQVAVSLLREATSEPGGEGQSAGSVPPLLDQHAVLELIEMIAKEALRPNSTSPDLLGSLQEMMPVVEKYAPARAAQLRRRTEGKKSASAEGEEDGESAEALMSKYRSLFEKGSVDELLAAAPQVPEAMRDMVYQRVVAKLMEEGDADRARQIINERIKDPGQRKQMLAELDEMAAFASAGRGNIEQTRKMLATLRTNEERVMLLVQLATGAAGKGDKKTALQLLDEARGMTSARAKNFTQLAAQLAVAQAYASLDASRSLAILEPVVDQLNELLAAAVVLGGFFVEEFVKDDEIMMETLMQMSNELLVRHVGDIRALARADFERTRGLADRFQRDEVRTIMRLLLVQSILFPQEDPQDGRRIPAMTRQVIIESSVP